MLYLPKCLNPFLSGKKKTDHFEVELFFQAIYTLFLPSISLSELDHFIHFHSVTHIPSIFTCVYIFFYRAWLKFLRSRKVRKADKVVRICSPLSLRKIRWCDLWSTWTNCGNLFVIIGLKVLPLLFARSSSFFSFPLSLCIPIIVLNIILIEYCQSSPHTDSVIKIHVLCDMIEWYDW